MITLIATSQKANIGGSRLGRISRVRMRQLLAPMVRAASTKSRLAQASVLARDTRAAAGIDRMPSARVTLNRLWPR